MLIGTITGQPVLRSVFPVTQRSQVLITVLWLTFFVAFINFDYLIYQFMLKFIFPITFQKHLNKKSGYKKVEMKLVEETHSKEPIMFFELIEHVVLMYLKNMQKVRSSNATLGNFSKINLTYIYTYVTKCFSVCRQLCWSVGD